MGLRGEALAAVLLLIWAEPGDCGLPDVMSKVINKESGTWFLGVTIAVLASFLSTFGINLQKYSHMQNQRLPQVLQQPYYQQFLWCCGMCLLVASAVCDFVALAFVAQSLIAPLGALSLTANILVAPCFVKESISYNDILATGVTTVGCIIAVAAANHSNTTYTFNELVGFFATVPYLGFFFLTVTGMLCLNQWIDKLETQPELAEFKAKHLPVCYPIIAGTSGSFSVTFAKAFVELVKSTIYGKNEFLSPGPYIVTVFLVFFSVLQVHYLNKGLQSYPALTVIPVYQTCWILGCAAGGVVYFQEFKGFSFKDGFLFSLGLCITLLGVVLLWNKTGEGDCDPDSPDERDLWLKSRRSLSARATPTIGSQDTDQLITREVLVDGEPIEEESLNVQYNL
eukprot:TRINITY_DN5077_c0_g1_i1.p1 TRINITY_DN5077_c0_g1~~TRINITY_DN5077_c0_g1_i1.p1  ORF type:complete len:397 (+),score=110.90 TRINITY_DN5077_c0_g1_i1:154-1344(+)